MTLHRRILEAAPDVHVDEIVSPAIMRKIPTNVRRLFAPMVLAWAPNRAWGTSFHLGDVRVSVGNLRGHHIAMHPDVHGIRVEDATEIMRLHLEGVLLHELGHAMLDELLDASTECNWTQSGIYAQVAAAERVDGLVSTYDGPCLNGACDGRKYSANDVLHEKFAEAARWYWTVNRRRYPTWHQLVQKVVKACEILAQRIHST